MASTLNAATLAIRNLDNRCYCKAGWFLTQLLNRLISLGLRAYYQALGISNNVIANGREITMDYRLYAIRIFTGDWPGLVAFYRDVLALPVKFYEQQYQWAEFDLGGASLAVEGIDPSIEENAMLMARFVGISIQVDDIQQAYQTLSAKGVEFTQAPEKQAWGGCLAHFKDPSGNILTLLG